MTSYSRKYDVIFQENSRLIFRFTRLIFPNDSNGIFSSMLAKIQELILKHDITQLQNDPTYTIDASNGVYLVFMIIGIIGYFTIPTVAGWVIQAGGAGNYGKNVNYAAGKGAGIAGAVAGAAGGFAGGQGKQVLHSAGQKAKDVAGRLFHKGGNSHE